MAALISAAWADVLGLLFPGDWLDAFVFLQDLIGSLLEFARFRKREERLPAVSRRFLERVERVLVEIVV